MRGPLWPFAGRARGLCLGACVSVCSQPARALCLPSALPARMGNESLQLPFLCVPLSPLSWLPSGPFKRAVLRLSHTASVWGIFQGPAFCCSSLNHLAESLEPLCRSLDAGEDLVTSAGKLPKGLASWKRAEPLLPGGRLEPELLFSKPKKAVDQYSVLSLSLPDVAG